MFYGYRQNWNKNIFLLMHYDGTTSRFKRRFYLKRNAFYEQLCIFQQYGYKTLFTQVHKDEFIKPILCELSMPAPMLTYILYCMFIKQDNKNNLGFQVNLQ